jgi:site-specific DNA-methyltransferase (adenine-specific)
MDYMARQPDNSFDLAVCDPPYGIAELGKNANSKMKKYGDVGKTNDVKPTALYFKELKRISKNQIIWGYNHLSDMLPSCKEFIFWYKHQPVVHFSDGELAWTSFKKTAKVFDYPYFGSHGADAHRIHPTQKPIVLYNWIYKTYCSPGDRILDTHLGSGSSAIAAYYNGFDFVGCEKDRVFYDNMILRYNQDTSQTMLSF